MNEPTPFKRCTMCQQIWTTREDFLSDPLIRVDGYQVDFEKLEYGLFYFTHQKEGCFSTMALVAADFLDLYKGEKYTQRRTGLNDCPGYCLEKEQLDRCDAICECAFVREALNIIKNWEKQDGPKEMSSFPE